MPRFRLSAGARGFLSGLLVDGLQKGNYVTFVVAGLLEIPMPLLISFPKTLGSGPLVCVHPKEQLECQRD